MVGWSYYDLLHVDSIFFVTCWSSLNCWQQQLCWTLDIVSMISQDQLCASRTMVLDNCSVCRKEAGESRDQEQLQVTTGPWWSFLSVGYGFVSISTLSQISTHFPIVSSINRKVSKKKKKQLENGVPMNLRNLCLKGDQPRSQPQALKICDRCGHWSST